MNDFQFFLTALFVGFGTMGIVLFALKYRMFRLAMLGIALMALGMAALTLSALA